nr:retrovirus-related Pol polyprotein from transposon TNT 1-94 [Tanacetum cinerariifolium]
KKAQIKLYKTREDKELEKVIELENKVKVLDNIVYKTGQTVQTMNMLNDKCRTSFGKPEFLKKAQRGNPRLYDIGCYNDNLALMLAPDSDELIRLEKESRSKLSDLIRPFDYDKLNNLYDLFVPQREKSSEQHYFSERSRLSHINVNNGKSKEAFNKQTTLLEKRMDESIPLDKKCQSSLEIFKVKSYVNTIIIGVELCKQKIANRTYIGYIDPFIQSTIESNFCPTLSDQHREYYYADHMNAILGVYTELDEVTNLQCDYLELLKKYEGLETELSKSKMISKSFESVQKHAINLKVELQQCKEKIKNDMLFKVNLTKDFCKEREHYCEIQDLKAQLQDKGIVIRVIPTTSVSRPQLKRNPQGDRVMHNNSQGKKQAVEDQRRSVKLSKNKTSVTACNDSLNAKTLNVKSISAMCDKCVLIDKHAMLVQRGLQAQVRVVQTNKGTEFLNQTLHAYFAAEGIQHQTSVARTPEQNGIVERRNRTLVEAARTMLRAAKVPLFLWAEAIATAYGENLDKMKEKGDECIFVGYSTQLRAYRVFNKRTRVIMESIHVNFDELPQMTSAYNSSDPAPTCATMASVQICSDPAPECQTMKLEHDSLSPGRKCQENVSHGDKTEPHAENDEVAEDEFINIFSTPVQDQGETSSRHEAMADSAWIESMQEELHQFDRLDVWELVNRPLCKNVINLKWLWKNKRDKENTVIRNKSRLVAKGYEQKEGVF